MKNLTFPLNKMEIRDNYIKSSWIIPKSINKSLRVFGVCLIVVGVGTWFIPFTTLPLISVGLGLFGITIKQIQQLIYVIYWKIKNKVFFRGLKIKLRIWWNK